MQCTLLAILLAAPAPVPAKITPPQGPPPAYAIASMKDGKLQLQQTVLVPIARTETRQRVVNVGGRQQTLPYQVTVMSHQTQQRTSQVDRARFFDTAGKEIDATRAGKLLNREQVVLVSSDGKPLDPFYLKTVREGTLIVVRPMMSAPAVPDERVPQAGPGGGPKRPRSPLQK